MANSCTIAVGGLILRPKKKHKPGANSKLSRYDKEAAEEIQAAIPDYQFKNPRYLLRAFTHRSLTGDTDSSLEHNERMEFLGDDTLSYLIARYLYETYEVPEGTLSELRLLLRSNETLAMIGRSLGLDKHIRRSRGQKRSGDPSDKQVAATVEALICAIHEDDDFKMDGVWKFVSDNILPLLPELLEAREEFAGLDPKSALQNYAQAKYGITPVYEVVENKGKGARHFTTVALKLGDREVARETAESKKAASRKAAEKALKGFKNEP